MKTTSIGKILLVTFFVSLIMGFAFSGKKSIGKINFILGTRGDIKVYHSDFKNWLDARLFSPVYHGDHFKTLSESRCEIKLEDRSTIRIGENADFVLNKNDLAAENNSVLKKGSIWANIKQLFRKGGFKIRTPTAVCAVRGTIYRIDADSSTKVSVYKGTVDVGPVWMAQGDSKINKPPIYDKPHEVPGPTEVPGPFEVTLDQWVKIVAGQQIEIRSDGKYYKSKINTQADDKNDWVKWNKMRDSME